MRGSSSVLAYYLFAVWDKKNQFIFSGKNYWMDDAMWNKRSYLNDTILTAAQHPSNLSGFIGSGFDVLVPFARWQQVGKFSTRTGGIS